MKTENYNNLQKLVGKEVTLIELVKVNIEQRYIDGKSAMFSYQRTNNIFTAQIISAKGDNTTSSIKVLAKDLFGDTVHAFYGAINWDIRDSNNCPRICTENEVYEIIVK